MKNFIQNIIAINLGMLFATGLIISGMTQPQNIINFLDITGNWDPALLLVMVGAVSVYMLGFFFFIKKKDKPLFEEKFFIPKTGTIDKKLIIGSAIFGIGWGISGFCPGPGLASLLATSQAWVFVLSLIVGMIFAKFITEYKSNCCKPAKSCCK